jgi:hypothetical protein
MPKDKKISSPLATGAAGAIFEAHVQASYVLLMLTGGFAPCLPCWPIVEVKLQGRIEGYATDDLIVTVKNRHNDETRKLLGQVKRTVDITAASRPFAEFIHAAWRDFHNSQIFNRRRDVIALITGSMSAADTRIVKWMLVVEAPSPYRVVKVHAL